MLVILLWIIGIYAICIAGVHFMYWRQQRRQRGKKKWKILVVQNHHELIEWNIRALLLHIRLTGQPVRLLVMDRGSKDRTLPIIRRLSRIYGFDWMAADPSLDIRASLESAGVLRSADLSDPAGADDTFLSVELIFLQNNRPPVAESMLSA